MNLYILEQRWVTDSLPCPETVTLQKHLGRSENKSFSGLDLTLETASSRAQNSTMERRDQK